MSDATARTETVRRQDGTLREVPTTWFEVAFLRPWKRPLKPFTQIGFESRMVQEGLLVTSCHVRAESWFAARAALLIASGLEPWDIRWLHNGAPAERNDWSRIIPAAVYPPKAPKLEPLPG